MKLKTILFLFFILSVQALQCSSGQNKNVKPGKTIYAAMAQDTLINRKPAVAGSFYPGNPDNLKKQIESHFNEATPRQQLGNICAVIVPHAGYVYSGTVAASAFNQLSPDQHYDNIFVIGSSHHEYFEGASIYAQGNFITPLGTVDVNIPLATKLINDHPRLFKSYPSAHQSEHSLEVQLPFLQYIYGDNMQIIPIVLGTQSPNTCAEIAKALSPYLRGNNLFVISTDFSHYPDYEDAVMVDASTANAIVTNSADEFLKTIRKNETKNIPNLATTICGWTSMLTLLDITSGMPGVTYHKIRYMNSGDASVGEKSRVVGYHAIVVTDANSTDKPADLKEDTYQLSDSEKKILLSIARNTIEEYLKTENTLPVEPEKLPAKLRENAGAFVTINKDHALRGCIGQFAPDKPLYSVVQNMAIAAATRDYRFTRLTPDELDNCEIEISVLTPMRRIDSTDEIVLGKHGIYIRKGSHSGTFLPQVANQTNWNLEEFLGHCAHDKAGLDWDGWKDAEVYVYEAYVFKEQ